MPAMKNSNSLPYPMTSMNFIVTAGTGVASFSEVTGIEASVDVVEFRQGNSTSLAPIKVPGLVHHGNITLKYGYIVDDSFRDWVAKCVSSERGIASREQSFRLDVRVELMDTGASVAMPNQVNTNAANAGGNVWVFKDAWVTKYNGPDMNAMNSEIAVESIELAYESLIIAGSSTTAPSAGGAGAAS